MMAKKMILVDPQRWESMQGTTSIIPNVLSSSISALDRDMKSILEDQSDEDIYTKAKKYQQMLNRYILLTEKYKNKTEKEEVVKNKNPETSSTNKNIQIDLKSKVLESIPKNLRSKASGLIDYINHAPNINWDQNLQLIVDGQIIEGSNVIDLLHDIVRNRKNQIKKPEGWDSFASALKQQNVPKEFIGNSTRMQWMDQFKKKKLNQEPVKWESRH